MKVLITGGTGFIGSRLAIKSIEKGHTVILLGQKNTVAEQENIDMLTSLGARVELVSVLEREKLVELTQGCDVVFHLAAAQHEANVGDSHFRDINVEGTRNMLDASVNAGVKRFVHGSTIGVYGVALDGEINEQSALQPDNIYGVTKKEGEQLVLSYKDKLPITVIRISETYGPGDRRLLKLFKAIQKRNFFMIGGGENKHQLIFVDDLIDGMYLSVTEEKAVGEIFVLVGNEVLSTNEMVSTIADGLGVRLRGFRSPLWPFMVIAFVLEKTLKPLGIQPPLHRRRMDFFRKSFYFSNEKSVNVLGFRPKKSFAEGVKETAGWYKENGFL